MNVSAVGSGTQATEQHHHGFARRVDALQKRIEAGVARGIVTPDEAASLEKSLAEIAHTIRSERETNGGKLTPEQRQQVTADLNNLSRQVFGAKHGIDAEPPVGE